MVNMDNDCLILLFVLFILFARWILIVLIFPFQVAYNWYKESGSIVLKVFAIPYWIWEKIFRGGWCRYVLFHVGYIPSLHIRRLIYKALGCKMGRNNVFHFRTEIREINQLHLGDGNIIGDNALLDARRGLVIGNNVNISSNVSIYSLQHDHRDPLFRCIPSGGKVVIEDRVWLGANVIVLPGVTIKEGAVCCAGCVVTKDVEPFSVVAGIPAKKVNERPRTLDYKFDGSSCRIY